MPRQFNKTDRQKAPDGTDSRLQLKELAGLLLLGLAAVLLRVGYLHELHDDPRLERPQLDSAELVAWAEAQATGDWQNFPAGLERLQAANAVPYVRPPGYPTWLAGWFKLAGTDKLKALVLQQMMGLLTVFLTWWAVRRWVSRRAAWFSGAVMAAYWPGIYYAGEFLDTALLTLLFSLLLPVAGLMADGIAKQKTGGDAGRRSMWLLLRALVAGVLLGLAIIIRPKTRFVAPVLVLWLMWVFWRQGNPSLKTTTLALLKTSLPQQEKIDADSDVLLHSMRPGRLLRWKAAFLAIPKSLFLARGPVLVFTVGLLAVTGPVLIRNARLGGFPAPLATGEQVAALVAAMPEYDGSDDSDILMGSRLDRICDYHHLAVASGAENAGDIVRHFKGSRKQLFRLYPEAIGRTLGSRLLLLWGPLEVGSSRVVEYDRQASVLLRNLPFSFPLLLAAGIYGFFHWLKTRSMRPGYYKDAGFLSTGIFKLPLLAAAVTVVFMSGHIQLLASGHLRQPVTPWLIFLAAWMFEDFCIQVGTRNWKETTIAAVTILCLYVAVAQNVGGHIPNRAKWLLDRSLDLEKQGLRDSALTGYRTVIMATPDIYDPESGVRMADSSIKHACDIKRFQKAAAVASMKLGIACSRSGNLQLALRYFDLTSQLQPDNTEALINAGVVLLEMKRNTAAVKKLEEALAINPAAFPAWYPLARGMYRLGFYEESLELLDRLLQIEPDNKPALRLRKIIRVSD